MRAGAATIACLARMAGARRALEVKVVLALSSALLFGCGQDDDTGPAGSETERAQQRHAREPGGEPSEPRRDGASYRAFVALEDEGRVAVLEGPPWRVVHRIRVPSGPHNVTADPAGRYVAVSSPPTGQVTILDARGRVIASPSAGAGSHDVAFSPSGGKLWVSAEDSGEIVELEVPSGRVLGSRGTSGPPHDLAVSPAGGELWVTIDGSSAVEVRSADSGELLARPTLGAAPHDVAIEPGGRRAWFSNWSSPLLSVASVPRRAVVGEVAAGGEPHHFAFGRRSLWASDNEGGELLRIDPGRLRIRGSTHVGPSPHHVAVAGHHVLVAVHGSGQLAVVSDEGRLLRRIDVGAGPHGIAALQR
jgi:DNA-binding beta-propeller fold protein YncE